MAVAARRSRPAVTRVEKIDKRDALLRAAIETFAARGFFNAQVADVARTAGVAAGTVYLYFRGKDDLLISIFEKTMKEAIAAGRESIARHTDPLAQLRTIARLHLDRMSRDRDLAVVFQVELRQSTKFMERFSATHLREYLGIIRDVIARGQSMGDLPEDAEPDPGGEAAVRDARRDGHQLDPEPPQVLADRRRRRHRRSVRPRSRNGAGVKHIRTAAVLGAGTMGAQIAAHLANAGLPTLLLDVTAEAAAQGLTRARGLKPDPFFTKDTATLIRTGSLDDLSGLRGCDWVIEAVIERLDVKRALVERVERATGDSTIVSSNTSGIPLASIAEGRTAGFRQRWLGTHFFNPPRYLALLEVMPPPIPIPPLSERSSSSPTAGWAKGSCLRKIRRASLPIASASSA